MPPETGMLKGGLFAQKERVRKPDTASVTPRSLRERCEGRVSGAAGTEVKRSPQQRDGRGYESEQAFVRFHTPSGAPFPIPG